VTKKDNSQNFEDKRSAEDTESDEDPLPASTKDLYENELKEVNDP